MQTSGSLGLLHRLEAAWNMQSGEVQGLMLLDVIGRGGSATVLKGKLAQAGRACAFDIACTVASNQHGPGTSLFDRKAGHLQLCLSLTAQVCRSSTQ